MNVGGTEETSTEKPKVTEGFDLTENVPRNLIENQQIKNKLTLNQEICSRGETNNDWFHTNFNSHLLKQIAASEKNSKKQEESVETS